MTEDQIRYLDDIKELVPETIKVIQKGDIKELGALLNVSWEYKKRSNKGVSNKEVDNLMDKAKKLGALGGKICGAGENGYCFFLVDPLRQEQFKKDIGIKWVDFSIDWSGLSVRRID